MRLSDLSQGDTCHITGDMLSGEVGRRLRQMGVLPGTPATCLLRHPAGDPAAYLVGETLLAMRRVTAGQILVEK